MAGSFTKDVVASSLGAEWVGYLMALRNLAGVASGVLLGRWSDSVGRFPCYLLALSCEGVMAVAMVSATDRNAGSSRDSTALSLCVMAAPPSFTTSSTPRRGGGGGPASFTADMPCL